MPTTKSASKTNPQLDGKTALGFDIVFRKTSVSSNIIVLEDDIAGRAIVTTDNVSGRILVATVDNISGRLSQKYVRGKTRVELDAEIARFYKYLAGLVRSTDNAAKRSAAPKAKSSTKRNK
jgi:hypothetical protein